MSPSNCRNIAWLRHRPGSPVNAPGRKPVVPMRFMASSDPDSGACGKIALLSSAVCIALGTLISRHQSPWLPGKAVPFTQSEQAMRFVICCPDNSTGGPFALLQLNQALLELGVRSEMLFYDKAQITLDRSTGTYTVRYSRQIDLKVAFASYGICSSFDRDTILVIPEVRLRLAKKFHALGHRKSILWWLSWDNAPIGELNKFDNAVVLMSCLHIFQSEYARRKAAEIGLRGPILSDWTIFPERSDEDGRQAKTNEVCFLATKAPGTEPLIAALERQFPVVPIRGMTHAEVWQILDRCMIFLDFGHQPGKDRMPREAVMHDCVPIVRNVGSAVLEQDCPLPASLKLDTGKMASSRYLGEMIRLIQARYVEALPSLQPIRSKIKLEKKVFQDQVRSLLTLLEREAGWR